MTYRVIISDEALAQAKRHLLYLAEEQQMPLTAQRWWDKALKAVARLEILPHRCPRAPEDEYSANELRMLVVDGCLFIYHVDDESRRVDIVKFRHGRQLP